MTETETSENWRDEVSTSSSPVLKIADGEKENELI